MGDFKEDRVSMTLEGIAIDSRLGIERVYAASPKKTHAMLVSLGYWDMAAQLQIDHAVGRLG